MCHILRRIVSLACLRRASVLLPLSLPLLLLPGSVFHARSQGTIDSETLRREVGTLLGFSNQEKIAAKAEAAAAAARGVVAPMPLMPDSGILKYPPVTAEDLLEEEANKMDKIWEKALVGKPEQEDPEQPEEDGESLVDLNVARVLVLISAALYGTNFGSVKILQGLMDPSLAAAARFSIAAVALSPLLRSLKGRDVVEDGLKIGALNALGYIAQGMSLETADASTAAFLCSLAVVVCPMMDAIAGVKVSASAWVAVALAVGGAAALELGGGAAPGMGDLLALVQPLAFGAGFWMMERAMRKNPDQGGPLTAVQLIAVALGAMLWSVLSETSGTPTGALPSMDAIIAGLSEHNVQLALAWTGLVTTALTVFLETMALGKLPSAEVTVLFSTEPLWGTAFAAVALGEQIGMNTIAGGSLIMAAVATRTFGGSKEGEKFIEGLKSKLGLGGGATPS